MVSQEVTVKYQYYGCCPQSDICVNEQECGILGPGSGFPTIDVFFQCCPLVSDRVNYADTTALPIVFVTLPVVGVVLLLALLFVIVSFKRRRRTFQQHDCNSQQLEKEQKAQDT